MGLAFRSTPSHEDQVELAPVLAVSCLRGDRRQRLDRDGLLVHRSPACRQVKPHLQVNVDVFAPYPSFRPGSICVSRIFPPHDAQVARGTAG